MDVRLGDKLQRVDTTQRLRACQTALAVGQRPALGAEPRALALHFPRGSVKIGEPPTVVSFWFPFRFLLKKRKEKGTPFNPPALQKKWGHPQRNTQKVNSDGHETHKGQRSLSSWPGAPCSAPWRRSFDIRHMDSNSGPTR